ncbi:tyrosine-type recombinase/integrase [Paenibacillus elgii]|uniref:tyrosine-type recombinase/integrase n=1 Tax=Paenibacillus elgii TaxID=189691 RepID=UPI00203C7244|nr:tyrosine-type recombinase/integrase [Paenibacillus elgii]MCM3272977.1 tyrosine-type recombinase/integrase [Paenibacillus elgii]
MGVIKRSRRPNTIAATVDSGESKYAAESLDLDVAIATFLRHCRVKNLTKETIRYYNEVLSYLKKTMADIGVDRPIDLTKEHVDEIILARQDGNVSDATVNSFLRGIRSFFNYLHNEGFITDHLHVSLIKAESHIIKTFTKEQIKRVLAAPNKATFTGYRDYVLMLLLLDTGIRVSEAEGILLPGINWKDRSIKVFGKGRKERIVPFQSTLETHLREYVTIRGPLEHDFLFVNIDNSPMRKRTMQENISDYGKIANIKGVRVSPHTFRHTFARLYITNGGDIFSLQKILGHSSLDIVRQYVNLFGTDVARQHRKYSPLDRLDEAD